MGCHLPASRVLPDRMLTHDTNMPQDAVLRTCPFKGHEHLTVHCGDLPDSLGRNHLRGALMAPTPDYSTAMAPLHLTTRAVTPRWSDPGMEKVRRSRNTTPLLVRTWSNGMIAIPKPAGQVGTTTP